VYKAASVTRMIFSCRYHFQADSKQPYNHLVKLPDGRFSVIRFSGVLQLSGSVPRSGKKQSAEFRWWADGRGAGDKHYI